METIAYTPTQKALLSLVREKQKTSTLITIKEAACKLKCSMKKVVEAAEDMCLNINVGFVGSGGYACLPRDRHTIEDLNAPYYE